MLYENAEKYLHITPSVVEVTMPQCKDATSWAQAFDDAIEFFGGDIDVAMLLAQVGHESADLTRLEERLYYTAKRMTQVWPSRYPSLSAAKPYARNPEALANHTYGGRMGNAQPGDGWKYRGRGPIQITGRNNYTALENATGMRCIDNPDLLLDPDGGAMSAVWYYVTNVPKRATLKEATKRINGGYHGIDDRQMRYNRAKAVLDEHTRERGG